MKLVAVCLVFLLIACTVAQKTDTEPIKLGATLALSGKYVYIGDSERRGLELGVAAVNAEGGINGKPLELVLEDNAGDAKLALSSVQKLLTVDDVDIVFSAFTHITVAINETVVAAHKPLIYASSVGTMAQASSLVFRDYIDAGDNAVAVANLVNKQGYKTVSLLSETSEICKEFDAEFKRQAAADGISIAHEENFVYEEKDFKTIFLKLGLSDVDAMVACAWRNEDIVMKQYHEQGYTTPTIHWIVPFFPAADTPEMRAIYEENKLITTWYGPIEAHTPKEKAFFSLYEETYGEPPRADALYAYDDVFALADALRACDEIGLVHDADCFSVKFARVDHDGVGGKLKFTDDRLSIRPVYSQTVMNGEWVSFE